MNDIFSPLDLLVSGGISFRDMKHCCCFLPPPRLTSCSVKSDSFWNLLTASQISSELSLRSRPRNCGCCLIIWLTQNPPLLRGMEPKVTRGLLCITLWGTCKPLMRGAVSFFYLLVTLVSLVSSVDKHWVSKWNTKTNSLPITLEHSLLFHSYFKSLDLNLI